MTLVAPIEQTFNVARMSRRWFGVPVRALNLEEGTLTASTFLEPRNPADLSPEDVRRGPTRPEDVLVPPVIVTKPKVEGKTAGFFVTDARGTRYLLKLDPPETPELLTAAEVAASRLLFALGYRVPSYEIVWLAPEEIRLGEAPLRGRRGRRFTSADLGELLQAHLHEGRVRLVSSKLVEGDILGRASFKRFRDCAEVRSLKVAYAWVNDIDTKDHNTLLTWAGDETRGYLIDFGTALGADAGRAGAKGPCAGRAYIVDPRVLPLRLLTLGAYRGGCAADEAVVSPAVGRFSPQVDPDRWKPYAPNRAFHELDDEDARWMARRMARLSRAHIEAAVAAGRYSRAEDAAYLVETLEARRRAIVHHYLEEGTEE